MRELVEFLARSIVDHPDDVEVEEEEDGDFLVYHLYVHDEDMGKVIGREGRIANAMRSLLKVAAARNGVRVSLEIGR
jgi:predicted RNA-binding protein YlqC (UPF0109 family)